RGVYVGGGSGDIFIRMLTASIAVGLILQIGNSFGSVSIVLTPIVVGVGAGFLGFYLMPFVKAITSAIGSMINNFTTLQP
ncbi:PTS sugar transporter subunit IIC, partial [Enterococcus faecium]|uniref:PTS sugar transporter subunit IIC n=1 Tax=Enterococcus faecium TaxID=1352 RepID=UPI003CC61A1D